MSSIRQLRRALLDGAMVVVPIGAVVLLVLAILRKGQDASEPVSRPIGHPGLVAAVLRPLLPCLKVISSWGLGLREISEAQAASQGPQADHERLEPAASAAVSLS